MVVILMSEIRLITLDPGHFHAALVQKETYPDISKSVSVFAPMTTDLVDHLARVARFNERAEAPTGWEEEVHAAPDFLKRMLAAPPGNVVILSGRNRGKIDYIDLSIQAGLNVLADKPWIISSDRLPKLASALDAADNHGLIAYDIMTERFEVTSQLQRELVNAPAVFGDLVAGSVEEPCVYMESVHHIMKLVAGVPLRRPAWFFDIAQQGEGLADVGPHLVDLAQWTLFPGQAVNHSSDIEIHAAKRWPTVVSDAEFREVTGEDGFPEYLDACVNSGQLEYFCNNEVSYSVRGVHVKLDVLWNYTPPEGAGDTHFAVYRGGHSRVEVRQDASVNYRPELYVVPNDPGNLDDVAAAVRARIEAVQENYPGCAVERQEAAVWVSIPDALRIGHEAHFAQVARKFFAFLRGDAQIPAWETPNMLAKYYVTTKGVELARDASAG